MELRARTKSEYAPAVPPGSTADAEPGARPALDESAAHPTECRTHEDFLKCSSALSGADRPAPPHAPQEFAGGASLAHLPCPRRSDAQPHGPGTLARRDVR